MPIIQEKPTTHNPALVYQTARPDLGIRETGLARQTNTFASDSTIQTAFARMNLWAGTNLNTRDLVDVTDAFIRASARMCERLGFEATNENVFVRGFLRSSTEMLRKSTELGLERFAHGESINKADAMKALLRAAENSAASMVCEPYFFDFPVRIFAGAGNFGLRVVARSTFLGTGLISKEQFGINNLAEEAFSRTAFRAIYLPTNNLAVRFGMSTLEQLAINSNLHRGQLLSRGLEFAGLKKATIHAENNILVS